LEDSFFAEDLHADRKAGGDVFGAELNKRPNNAYRHFYLICPALPPFYLNKRCDI
jgi:hypothetical protein